MAKNNPIILWLINTNNMDFLFQSQAALLDYLYFGFDIYEYGEKYDVPVYFISGDNDWITPNHMVEGYYQAINARDKDMVIIKNAGHNPFLDNPKEFCRSVKSVLKK